jgi:DNA-binding LacI/PurR family transcriptional regulator
MLSSLADALTERGYDMLLSRIDAERLDLAGDLAASGRAIGVILIGQWHHHDQLNELAVRRAPVAVWGAQLSQQLYCTVGTDNVAGGTLATQHLLDIGRKRIAFFGDTTLPEVAQRYEGYCKALAQRGIRVDPSLVLRTPFLQGSAQRAVTAMLESAARFDGLFATSDLLAMGAIGALRDSGRQVPADVAVVGYDDIELARYFHPSLSTIRQPVVEGAAALVEALLAITRGERPKPKVIPSNLIVRASSAGEQDLER